MMQFKFLSTGAAVIGAVILFAALGAVVLNARGMSAQVLLATATLCAAIPKYLYTTREAKAALGIGETRLYELINAGVLDARRERKPDGREGRRIYITADSIEAYASSLKPATTPTMTRDDHGRWRGKARAKHGEGNPDATD
jgi:hypothetical protein